MGKVALYIQGLASLLSPCLGCVATPALLHFQDFSRGVLWPWICMSCPTLPLCLSFPFSLRPHCQLLAVGPPALSFVRSLPCQGRPVPPEYAGVLTFLCGVNRVTGHVSLPYGYDLVSHCFVLHFPVFCRGRVAISSYAC